MTGQQCYQYTAAIQGRSSAQGGDRVTYYDILVSDGCRSWQAWRRYTEFAALRETLCNCFRLPLPEMPPKSTFRLALFPAFQEERQSSLNCLLQAALRSDPCLQQFEA